MIDRLALDERLTLELLGEQHVVDGNAMVARSRAELLPWMPWAESTNEAAYRAYVSRVLADRAGPLASAGAAYAIVVNGAFAGCVDFHDEHPGQHTAAMGYWLGTPFVGHGWMTKSVVALTELGVREFGLRRIEIFADVDNLRSRAVAQRAGFTFETIRPRRLADGRMRDEALYVRLAPEDGPIA